jgi:8-oxo-dGTP pyrophosphatase MutT (NUDIX family)
VDREVFRGRLIRVRVDEQGYELVEHPPAVVIVALDVDAAGDCPTWLVRVRRPATGRSLVEAPAGLIDEGETPEQAARRELREECGLEADHWEELGSAWSSPGFTDERIHLFLATGLRHVGGDDPDGVIEERFQAPLSRALHLAGESMPSRTALLLAARKLSQK